MTTAATRPWHRRRALSAVGALLVVAACASPVRQASPANQPPPAPVSQAPQAPTGSVPSAAATPACGPLQRPPPQEGGHLIGDTAPPVPYSSVPPTSGWHASGAVDIAVRPPERPLTEAEQVAVLEAGAVVVSYRGLPDVERAELEALVARHFPRRVAVTSYQRLETGEVALTAWGVLQLCDGFDPAAVTSFVTDHAAGSPQRH